MQEVQTNEGSYKEPIRKWVPILTYSFIAINLIVFIFFTIYSYQTPRDYNELVLQYGAKVNQFILQGEIWRLITPMFFHSGLLHVLVNCYSLYIVGPIVERLYGRLAFVIVYILSGILGNIASFAFLPNTSVGASGAIFGLLGALLYLGVRNPAQFKAFFGKSILFTILINLAYGLSYSGIDNFAHIGGLIGGFLSVGIVVRAPKKCWYLNRYLYSIALILLVVGGTYYGFNNQGSRLIRDLISLEKLEQQEDWKAVEEKAESLIETEYAKEQGEILWTLIRAQVLQGKYEEAILNCDKLIKLEPALGYYLRGIIHLDEGEYEEARETLEKAKRMGANAEQVDKLLNTLP